jgi:hypothetical protein
VPLNSLIISIVNSVSLKHGELNLRAPEISKRFVTVDAVVREFVEAVKHDAIQQVPTLLSHTNAAGNIGGTIDQTKNALNHAADAAAHGDVGGMVGGGAALIASGVGGVANVGLGALSGATGAIASGAKLATGGKEGLGKHVNRAAQQMSAALGDGAGAKVVGGIVEGFGSAIGGVVGGVGGLVYDPMKGFQTGGFLGMMKGMGTGLAGVVARPVSGIVGGVSKLTGGMRAEASNIVTMVSDAAAGEGVDAEERVVARDRARLPRPLYAVAAASSARAKDALVRTFDAALARNLAVLRSSEHVDLLYKQKAATQPLVVCASMLADKSFFLLTTESVITVRDKAVTARVALSKLSAVSAAGTTAVQLTAEGSTLTLPNTEEKTAKLLRIFRALRGE